MFYDAITEFIFVENPPEKADLLLIPGNFKAAAGLAEHAAALFFEGYAPYIIPSGKYSITFKGKEREELQKQYGYETECAYLSALLEKAGVPGEVIFREEEAGFTWENAIYTKRLIEEKNLPARRAILCCQASHARRSLMYYQQQLPDTEFLVCPIKTGTITREGWYQTGEGIATVLGEVERCGAQFHEIMKNEAKKQ